MSEHDPIAQLVGRLSDVADVHHALDVATDAGVSHPTVRAVLRYTGRFLEDRHDRWQRTRSSPGRAGR